MSIDYKKEIDSLKRAIKELEAKISQKANSGKPSTELGSNNSDTIIKTLGNVKVKFGNKYVTIFKNGKLVCENNQFIFRDSKVGNKDGIYIIGEGDQTAVYIVSNGKSIDISNANNSYISFLQQQKTTPEQKEMALTNIGFMYKNLDDFQNSGILNSLVYIQDQQKLYLVVDGIYKEYTINTPKEFEEIKALNIKGDQLQIRDTTINEKFLNFKDYFTIGQMTFSLIDTKANTLQCNNIYGNNFSISNGVLSINKVFASNVLNGYPKYSEFDVITDITSDLSITTLYNTEYQAGELVLVETSENNIVLLEYSGNNIFISKSGEIDINLLRGQFIYSIKNPLIKIKDTLELIEYDDQLNSTSYIKIGENSNEYGLFLHKPSNNSKISFAKYSSESEEIPEDADPKTLVTIEWVEKRLSKQ